jgi:hypothetical protein
MARHFSEPVLRRPADYFKWGHRKGRADAVRRLWTHLDDDGRQLAAAIALEGADDDD